LKINKLDILAKSKALLKGTPRAFPNGAIEDGLCPFSRRK